LILCNFLRFPSFYLINIQLPPTTMAPITPEEEPKKRGRGRPPKADGQKKAAYVPTGRPRGRPKGSGGVKKAAAPKPAAGTGRGRGRPRKSDVAEATASPKPSAATPRKSTPAKSTGRPRGRPRKSDASTTAPTPKSAESAKSKAKNSDDSMKESSLSDSSSASDEEGVSSLKCEDQGLEDVAKSPSDAAEEVRRWFPPKMIRGLFG
ncbi:AT hook domain-containing protein, partial [Colletotrichum tofieldiae]